MPLILDIRDSFRAMPNWVQFWVAIILVPVNMYSLFFIDQPQGILIAVLAISAMMLNFPIMLYDRGFSKLMAFPHLLPWSILIALLVISPPMASGSYHVYLWVLLIVDAISLVFDYPDALKWWRGDRKAAGRE